MTIGAIIGSLLVKSIIWSVSLGSGTSGGVLAPLLMMGGTMRAPFTGIIFALELTRDINALLPLLVAVVIAHGFTVLVMRRSILTEKISRRSYHLSREYAVDPLEIIFAREVMRTNIAALPAHISQKELDQSINSEQRPEGQYLYPVVDDTYNLIGVITRKDLLKLRREQCPIGEGYQLAELIEPHPVVAFPDDPLRVVVFRMAETGFTRLPVVNRESPQKLVGIISLRECVTHLAIGS